jgi:hypothetical protein
MINVCIYVKITEYVLSGFLNDLGWAESINREIRGRDTLIGISHLTILNQYYSIQT